METIEARGEVSAAASNTSVCVGGGEVLLGCFDHPL